MAIRHETRCVSRRIASVGWIDKSSISMCFLPGFNPAYESRSYESCR
jgi:hypothetical protein